MTFDPSIRGHADILECRSSRYGVGRRRDVTGHCET
jgi:hypothetical protein